MRAAQNTTTQNSMSKHPRELLLGFAGGIGAALILPFILPVVSQTARPIAKVLLKQTLLAVERLRTLIARSSESLEDLIAEARAEVAQELEAERLGQTPGGADSSNLTEAIEAKQPSSRGTLS
jgi:hypothetical protein